MVPLARAVLERGHALRWATAPDAGQRLASVGIETIATGPTFDDVRG
jgi:UDP:flavonoid glycosyltransferase YjiC (YdhE family)